jgi:hypothetical protein
MRINKAKDGMLTYRYRAGGCIDFKFHLLSEVGEPWQPSAKKIIAKHGWKIEQRDAPAPTHYADFVIGEKT